MLEGRPQRRQSVRMASEKALQNSSKKVTKKYHTCCHVFKSSFQIGVNSTIPTVALETCVFDPFYQRFCLQNGRNSFLSLAPKLEELETNGMHHRARMFQNELDVVITGARKHKKTDCHTLSCFHGNAVCVTKLAGIYAAEIMHC